MTDPPPHHQHCDVTGPPPPKAVSGATTNISDVKPKLFKLFQLHGYAPCNESFTLLVDHFMNSNWYESMEDFVISFNHVVTFKTKHSNSLVDPHLAHLAISLMKEEKTLQTSGDGNQNNQSQPADSVQVSVSNLNVRVQNVEFDHVISKPAAGPDEFNIHYNYLYHRLSSMPVFSGDFQLTKLKTLTASRQPSIRCICFGLLVRDLSKIDGYLLIDSTGRVPLRIKPETTFRNRLAYFNCLVLVEGVYVNPDDVLFAANIGLPPILLDSITNKSLISKDDKMVIMLKELFLDDEDVVKTLDMLFTGYDSMEDPPLIFILIGNFTRTPCSRSEMKVHLKKLSRIIRLCDNLKNSHFVFVPGPNDTIPSTTTETGASNLSNVNSQPKPPFTKEQFPINMLQLSGFSNVHFATNPTHIYVEDRIISVVSYSYIKELHKNLLHDLSDHREELFDAIRQIILSNGHFNAGISKVFSKAMSLWHRPDLLILADSGAFGSRYDYSFSKTDDTSFATLPSFARQSHQFKVYYLNSGELEDSQVSSDALHEVEDLSNDEHDEMAQQFQEPVPTDTAEPTIPDI